MLTYASVRRPAAVHGLAALMPIDSFIAEDVFLTKAGQVGVAWRVAGVDPEGLDQAQRAVVVQRFTSALRLLDEHDRLYSYLIKSPAPPITAAEASHPAAAAGLVSRAEALNARALFEVDLYLVVLRDAGHSARSSMALHRSLWAAFSPTAATAVLDREMEQAIRVIRHTADGLEAHLADVVSLTRLLTPGLFRFFRRLVNYGGPDVRQKYDRHVDYFMADAGVSWYRTGSRWDRHHVHLEVGREHVKVLSMKDAPTYTQAVLLDDLIGLPTACIACLEWTRIPNDVMRRLIADRSRHFNFKKRSAPLSTHQRPEDLIVDASAEARLALHGQALTEMEANGRYFGACALTLVLHDRDPECVERSAAEAMKVLAVRDGAFIDESYNLLNAWTGIVPGDLQTPRTRRTTLPLLDTNAADLACLFAPDAGVRETACAVLEARHRTVWYYTLHVQDVGHTVMLGDTGSGKSFAMNFLVHHLQQRDPQTIIFDLGHSYRTLATSLGGSYLELGLHAGVRINPFSLAPTPENLHFIHAFCRVLIDGADGYVVSDEDDADLYDAVRQVYVLPAPLRQLGRLLPCAALRERLQPWIGTGKHAALFDHAEDTLELARFQVFEFGQMEQYPHLIEPLVFYVLHRVLARMRETNSLTICVMDEAWRLIQHPRLRDYVESALRTWRKQNGAMLLATQAVEDFIASDLLRPVVDACHTKIFLAKPDMDRERYAVTFNLNEQELDLMAGLLPKREWMVKRTGKGGKVVTLNVDPVSAAMYAAKGPMTCDA